MAYILPCMPCPFMAVSNLDAVKEVNMVDLYDADDEEIDVL